MTSLIIEAEIFCEGNAIRRWWNGRVGEVMRFVRASSASRPEGDGLWPRSGRVAHGRTARNRQKHHKLCSRV